MKEVVKGLRLDDISVLFDDVVVTITNTTKLPESDNHHNSFISYSVHMYCPRVSWTVQKRYRDFLHLHEIITHMVLEDMPKAFISLLNFEFPAKHFRTSKHIVNERKTAFVKFIEKALTVPDLHSLMADFLHVNENVSREHLLVDETDINSSEDDEPQFLSREMMSRSKSQIFAYKNTYNSSKSLRNVIKPYRLQRELDIRRASSVLTRHTCSVLYSYLPSAVHNESFQLAYATHRDGWSLCTLYEKVGTLSPCIVLIKELSGGDVVGAFLNCPLTPPSLQDKGDWTCFVFKLSDSHHAHDSPTPCCCSTKEQLYNVPDVEHGHHSHNVTKRDKSDYNTDGCVKYSSVVSVSSNQHHDVGVLTSQGHKWDMSNGHHRKSTNTSSADPLVGYPAGCDIESFQRQSTLLQFAVAAPQFLLFGGSRSAGSNAIRLGMDLVYCSTGPSDTYGNPKLTSSNVQDPFQVADVEVFCGAAYH